MRVMLFIYHNPKGSCAVYRQEKKEWFLVMINYSVVVQHVCLSITNVDLQDEMWSLSSPLMKKLFELRDCSKNMPYGKIMPTFNMLATVLGLF